MRLPVAVLPGLVASVDWVDLVMAARLVVEEKTMGRMGDCFLQALRAVRHRRPLLQVVAPQRVHVLIRIKRKKRKSAISNMKQTRITAMGFTKYLDLDGGINVKKKPSMPINNADAPNAIGDTHEKQFAC